MNTSNTTRLLLRRALAATTEHSLASATATTTRSTSVHAATTVACSRRTAPGRRIARRWFGVPANQIADHHHGSSNGGSSSSSPANDSQNYERLVEESIKKLMTDAQEEPLTNSISNEELEVRLSYFQKVFEEAELCLSDLRETLFEVDDEQYREECSCAEGALNNAFTAYIDLLEDFRRSTEEQLHTYSEERNTNANNLKRLRKELDQIIEVANNRDRAST